MLPILESKRSTASLFAKGEPLAVGAHGELDERAAALALHVGRALALLEKQTDEPVAQAIGMKMGPAGQPL